MPIRNLIATLIAASMLAAQPPVPASLKQQISLIAAGAPIEVRTIDKRKLRGLIGSIDDSGFQFRRVENGRIIDQRMPFGDVHSVKELERSHSRIGRIVLWTLAVFGACAMVTGILIGG